jgi:hypothetical protein
VLAIDPQPDSWQQVQESAAHGTASFAGMQVADFKLQEVPQLAKSLDTWGLLRDEEAETVHVVSRAIVKQAQVRSGACQVVTILGCARQSGASCAGLRDGSMPASQQAVRCIGV